MEGQRCCGEKMTLDTHIKNWHAEEVREELKLEVVNNFIDDLRYYIESIVLPYKPKVQVMIYDWYNNYNINDMVK